MRRGWFQCDCQHLWCGWTDCGSGCWSSENPCDLQCFWTLELCYNFWVSSFNYGFGRRESCKGSQKGFGGTIAVLFGCFDVVVCRWRSEQKVWKRVCGSLTGSQWQVRWPPPPSQIEERGRWLSDPTWRCPLKDFRKNPQSCVRQLKTHHRLFGLRDQW